MVGATAQRRNATVEVSRLDKLGAQGPVDLIVDSTGLQVCGQGEWHAGGAIALRSTKVS